MRRYELNRILDRIYEGHFQLSESEAESLSRQNPSLLSAWRKAEAAVDYLQILFEREKASMPDDCLPTRVRT